MRQRSFIFLAVAVAALILGAVGVYAYDRTRDDVIAHGVTAGGVDLSGMRPAKARATLERELAQPLREPVTVVYRKRRFALAPDRAKLRVDVDAMVDRALARSHDGTIVSRTARALTGDTVHAAIPVAVSYSDGAVKRFVARVKHKVDQPAQDAKVSFSGSSLGKVPERTGRAVEASALATAIQAKLGKASGERTVPIPVRVTRPKVTTAQLADRYATVITVDRDGKQLHLWKRLREDRTYPIAVGMAGLETPAGLYQIQDKQTNPSWHVPNSSWAGKLAGRVIPPGPDNPIKARWMGIYNGAGIHGTADSGSLGSAASHGCIRMAIPDVEALYDEVSVGTPVYIQ